jgi:peptidoglycan-associated lipoprotein
MRFLKLASLRSPIRGARRAACFAMLGALGCGASPPPPSQSASTAPPAPEPARSEPSRAAAPNATTVAISDEIQRLCGISERDAYFAFDSTRVTSGNRNALDGVARCFSAGPLKGRQLTLVGHADPRGETEYNMTLGLSRADAVGRYLVARGVASKAAKTTSRGAMDAAGTDETSWQRDRRVDVTLGD